jgi:hypothetical protein
MVTVIANQKRTTATYGDELPVTFDPLDGNANQWLRPLDPGVGFIEIPCVCNWMRIAMFYYNDDPWEVYPMELEYKDETFESFDVYPDNSYGSGKELIQVNTVASPFYLNRTELLVPVWGREVVAIRGSVQITAESISFGAEASFGLSNTIATRFFYDVRNFPLATYDVDYEVTIANTGKVSHSLTIS